MNANEFVPEIDQARHEKLCAYLFGELAGDERAAFEAELARSPELERERARLAATIGLVKRALPEERLPEPIRRDLVAAARRSRFRVVSGRRLLQLAAAFLVLIGGAWTMRAWLVPASPFERSSATEPKVAHHAGVKDEVVERQLGEPAAKPASGPAENLGFYEGFVAKETAKTEPAARDEIAAVQALGYTGEEGKNASEAESSFVYWRDMESDAGDSSIDAGQDSFFLSKAGDEGLAAGAPVPATVEPSGAGPASPQVQQGRSGERRSGEGAPSVVVTRRMGAASKGRGKSQAANVPAPSQTWDGKYRGPSDTAPPGDAGQREDRLAEPSAGLPARARIEHLEDLGYLDETGDDDLNVGADMAQELQALGYAESVPAEGGQAEPRARRVAVDPGEVAARTERMLSACRLRPGETPADMFFRCWGDNPFVAAADDPLSTFAVDVDTASYTLARAFLMRDVLPPEDAVRTEEFVNYFRADQPAPQGGDTFALGLEAAPSPFAGDPRVELLRVTLRGKDLEAFERRPLALTFVVDISNSMKQGGRLDLVKEALALLLRELGPSDSIALVAFSQQARVVSEPTSARNRAPLETALFGLEFEGGTNVEAGLVQGYALAAAHLAPSAVNRVVLFSDGVGNIGVTESKALVELVRENRAKGIYLNTFGVGMGNLDDEFLEQLADHGDGLCQYVDTLEEARRALVDGVARSFQPIARDVKIQVEFDPAQVESWRQLGYENRALRHEDFENDAIDAGEVNAGHQVSALYEIVRTPRAGGPFATVRVRWKPPFAIDRGAEGTRAAAAAEQALESARSIGGEAVLAGYRAGSAGYRRSALVAQFAEVLRGSFHARGDSFAHLVEEAQGLERELGDPEFGELVGLLKRAAPLVKARDERATPELERLLDELARLHYEAGRRERTRAEVDPELARSSAEEIAKLEAAVRDELARIHGVAPEGGPLDALKGLGYIGDDDK